MSDIEVHAPSGLRGIIRGIKGKQLNLLADPNGGNELKAMQALIEACWVETLDPGPCYPQFKDNKINVDKLISQDRIYLVCMVRAATRGTSYEFPVTCAACSHAYAWTINLTEDLEIVDLPEDSATAHAAGTLLWLTVGDKKDGDTKVGLKLATGRDERMIRSAQERSPETVATLALVQQIYEVRIEGAEPMTDKRHIAEWVDCLDLSVIEDIAEEFRLLDAEFRTSVPIQCPTCDVEASVELPFEQASFWTPPKTVRPTRAPRAVRKK